MPGTKEDYPTHQKIAIGELKKPSRTDLKIKRRKTALE
jgi:hypothetical protein